MPIVFYCPHCDKKFRAQDHFAGRRIKCSRCAEVVTIPDAVDMSALPPAQPTEEQQTASSSGDVPGERRQKTSGENSTTAPGSSESPKKRNQSRWAFAGGISFALLIIVVVAIMIRADVKDAVSSDEDADAPAGKRDAQYNQFIAEGEMELKDKEWDKAVKAFENAREVEGYGEAQRAREGISKAKDGAAQEYERELARAREASEKADWEAAIMAGRLGSGESPCR